MATNLVKFVCDAIGALDIFDDADTLHEVRHHDHVSDDRHIHRRSGGAIAGKPLKLRL
jgi:hypothetical protein